ncbi:Uncharacterised protein [Mycobacterium tuberculosis]|nr:Uncharacterised protein [Mycobacterium tuberculosis]
MWSSYSSCEKPISFLSESSFSTAAGPTSREQVKVMSVLPSSTLETFCSTMSMLTSASATALNTLAAYPGMSGSPTMVTLASLRSCATPVRMGSSMGTSLIDPTTTVPGLSEYDDRTCTGILWRRAYSTQRSISTLAPQAAISSISSKVTVSSFRALRTMRGSALKMPSTSV